MPLPALGFSFYGIGHRAGRYPVAWITQRKPSDRYLAFYSDGLRTAHDSFVTRIAAAAFLQATTAETS